jgi:UDP-2,3-diacylglucosamine hydrolase
MSGGGRYIFASDMHLGAASCPDTESQFIAFLNGIPAGTRALYLLGDVFDFWFERRRRPLGFERVLEAIKTVVDRGVEVFFLRGNHDWWTFGRLESRTGLTILDPQPVTLELCGKRFCIAHGDDLGPLDFKARLTRLFLKGRLHIFFARYILPERWLYSFAAKWTSASRHSNTLNPYTFNTDNPLYKFACGYEKEHPVDYFIFGHVHQPVDIVTPGGAGMHILNDWTKGPSWLEFDGETITRKGGLQ